MIFSLLRSLVLEIAAQKGFVGLSDLAGRYVRIGESEIVLQSIETGFEIRDPSMPFLTTAIEKIVRIPRRIFSIIILYSEIPSCSGGS